MGKGRDWDYALRIKGVTPKTIPMARLAEYLREFAGLLGEETRPVFAGMVGGSVVLRAQETRALPVPLVRSRLRTARVDKTAPGASHYARLNDLLASDGAEGIIVDRDQREIIELPGGKAVVKEPPPHIVSDVGSVDGVVISIGGRDETLHLHLQDFDGKVRIIVVRRIELARQLAAHFRRDPIRVFVHGTWRRQASGEWEPESLYADRFEELDSRSALEVFRELATIPGNGWTSSEDPEKDWRDIRGDE